MGGGPSKEEIMYNHEEEVMRIRNLREKNEQDAEIRRFIAENNLKLGEEEIKRLREKDLQEQRQSHLRRCRRSGSISGDRSALDEDMFCVSCTLRGQRCYPVFHSCPAHG